MMDSPPTLIFICLGGGVQSSVMALMASQGAFDRVKDCAIFADTRWEPPGVYEHLQCPKDRLSFHLYVTVDRRSLRENVKALNSHSSCRNYVNIPRPREGPRVGGRRHRQRVGGGLRRLSGTAEESAGCLDRPKFHVLDTGQLTARGT